MAELFDELLTMDVQEGTEFIAAKVAEMREAFAAAREVADELGLKIEIDFFAEIPNMTGEPMGRYAEFAYHGAYEDRYEDEVYPVAGSLYWYNSSMNC